MTFVHVRQPNDYTCACAVVAIVTGTSVYDLIAEMRPTPRRGTPHKRMVEALRRRGVACGGHFVSVRGKKLPHTAIVRVVHPDKQGHVVVKQGLEWFDPALEWKFTGAPDSVIAAHRYSYGHARITSFMWLGQEALQERLARVSA